MERQCVAGLFLALGLAHLQQDTFESILLCSIKIGLEMKS